MFVRFGVVLLLLFIPVFLAVPVACNADVETPQAVQADQAQQPHTQQQLDTVPQRILQPAEVAASAVKQLEANPDDINLRLLYADALFEMSKIDDALAEYQKVRDVDKNYSDAILGIACCRERQNMPAFALSEYKAACMADGSNATAVLAYLTLANKLGKLQEAIPSIRSLAQYDKHYAASCYWAVASWVVERDYYRAQPFAQEAHKVDPKCFPAESISPKPVAIRTGVAAKGVVLTPGQSRQVRISAGIGGGFGGGFGGFTGGSANRGSSGGASPASSGGGIGRGGGASGGGGGSCPPARPAGGGSG